MLQEPTLSDLRQLVGQANVLTSPSDLEAYGRDWTRVHQAKPSVIVLPASTAEVAAVVAYCQAKKLPIVPSGGRTGLAGAAVATNGEVVLSLSRMTKIEELDEVGQTIRVEAGITTQQVQEAAKQVGLFFPLDLAAKGSCQIGGNIATNAGGVKFIRFGGMREQVLGIEVVLPSGEVLDMNTGLRKNNTGYDLRQLFIGSEGTLGIVTRATLRLTPPPRNMQVSVLAVPSFESMLQILRVCGKAGVQLTAFEFFTRVAHEIVLQHALGARSPFTEKSPYYVISDAVVATSSAQFKELWGLRENITESLSKHGHIRKNDISLAIGQLAAFTAELELEVAAAPKDIQLVLFGHIGDGNLHINYVGLNKAESFADFNARARLIELRIFERLARYKGSISAEHGIGLLKKKDLHFSRSEPEVALMRQIKQLLDPANLLNPGKIFP